MSEWICLLTGIYQAGMAHFAAVTSVVTQMAWKLLQDWFQISLVLTGTTVALADGQKFLIFSCFLVSYLGYDLFIYCLSLLPK